MKKAVLIALSLSLPAFAASDFDSEDLSVDVDPETLVSQESFDEASQGRELLPFCWDLHYTSCPRPGATQACTDGIWSDYVCTCRPFGTRNVWDCPEVR
ncbi:hypothetical protein [Corallococcus macrosporus]|uniref:EGF-like domain-containing protein n=2 Tax=Myxococcaceae TaxID=31 RepID=A0A250JMD5_9BACT|nr:hypothetical protein [Corallococcus macrosporus]AEI63084.1 hypothetical protein LILAB_05815 [Corallococcus macrosporus]ATB45034.1 hypothetical protein MYMAC_000617 [Corallococcus macrosporus DSM 14697]